MGAHRLTLTGPLGDADATSKERLRTCATYDATVLEPRNVDPTEPAGLDALWEAFVATRTLEARNQLVDYYSPIVKYVARRMSAGLPQAIEHAHLVSYGMFGLMDAIDKFDPTRGNKFQTYAMSRIRTAIIDELRSVDWVPHSLRVKARTLAMAVTKLDRELLRKPTDAEVAQELGTSEAELHDLYRQISFFGLGEET
jgi:RNA polymerase sigma factor for flagellar operon FliA